MADAIALKDEGNRLFQSGDFLKAAAVYTQAIKADPENAVLYSNRSAALLKLKKITKAMEDAEMVIKLKPDWEKGYFRKGAVLEDQDKKLEALELYEHAGNLVPDSKELQVKIRTLKKLTKQMKDAASKEIKDTEAAIVPKQAESKAAAAVPQPQPQAEEVVYEDMGSEEVAAFTEEYLGVLAEEIRESGSDFIPMVHLLPGPKVSGAEEQDLHIRGAGAFESPQTLDGFVRFVRDKVEKVDAQAVLTLVPKEAIGFPRVWQKPKWPCGGADGVFAQLESREVKRCWFIPVEGKHPGTPASISAEEFGPMPKCVR